jgi:hypothetical protein
VGALAVNATPAVAGGSRSGHYQHVLLISIDGLHASDLAQCEANGDCPNLAALAGDGTTYTRAMTSEPSDSAPGTMALLTGADPKLSGVYYDDSYDRTMYQPAAQTATSTQDCTGPAGAETMLAENVDTNAPSTANSQTGTRTVLNETVDPTQLPYALQNGKCQPVLPNDFLRTNSVMSVAHAAGLRTAWADKHPVYNAEVAGNGTPNSVDDPFNTEINADIVPPTLTDTRGNTVTFPLPNPTGDPNGFFITDSVGNTEAYDQIKVDAILNEIDGMNSANTQHVGVPAIFGMNFQAVSVGQKLVDPTLSCVRSGNAPGCDPNYVPGGYEPGTLAFTPQLAGAVQFVDTAIGSMVQELAKEGVLDSTKIIISAKHGQSPIDPSKLALIGHAETKVLTNAGIKVAQVTDDDIALIWLADQSQTTAAVQALQADKAGANTAHIQYILAGRSLVRKFGSPLVDPRTPDIIIQPMPGTIYSTSNAKVMEHGGFAMDDTHVMMLVVDGWRIGGAQMAGGKWQMHRGRWSMKGAIVRAPVTTYQVAPTILASLGLNPRQLDSVRIEHVRVLPGQR